MKQIILILTLLVSALAPVAAQVQIDTGLTPSQMAKDIISSRVSAVKLLSYLFETRASDSCAISEIGDDVYSVWANACVFQDPIEDRLIFLALISEDWTGEDAIYLFRNGSLFRVAQATDPASESFLIVSGLPPGEYEVVFIWDYDDDQFSSAFYFWIDEQKEDSD